jgi:hypothetical protein
MTEEWTQEKQNKAEQLGAEITKQVYSVMSELPHTLDKTNLGVFVDACEQIDQICKDAFSEAEKRGVRDFFGGWRKLLIPFWKFAGDWANAYGEGFTWKGFLETILKENYTEVSLYNDKKYPSLSFVKNGKKEFNISLMDED